MKYNINTIGNTWSEFLKKNITTDEEVKIVLYKLTESVTERLCKHGFVRSVTQDYGTKKLYDFVDLIGAITYTPFIEELVFRGLFFNLTFNILDMENKVVKYIAITTNIMMFMSIHYVDYSLANYNILFSLLISVVPNLAISTSLVYVYFKTRDIKYNIILHMLYNFIIILISFIKQLY
ncbi:MAG: CPBP family intramembrane metalloprotease [Clostridioides difficile]|nr:CPBP family intramembrane metalloprotease [Clostridioides difficile]